MIKLYKVIIKINKKINEILNSRVYSIKLAKG